MSANAKRTNEIFHNYLLDLTSKTDRLFAYLFIGQWIVGILFAIFISPRTWIGEYSQVHIHVYAAIFLGGLIAALPVYLSFINPGAAINRMVVAFSQILFSILFIHLTGGRIESHFHIFGSLAFLAFYKDWRPVLLATIVTGLDHLIRGYFWPQSVYGVLTATPWRALEHAGWVVFEDLILFYSINIALKDLRLMSEKQAELEIAIVEINRANSEATTYKLALDNFAIVGITDNRGKITYANENFCKISKYSAEELIGKNHNIINSGHHSQLFFEEMWKSISTGRTWEGEIKNKARDGSFYWVDTSIVPIKDENGKIKEYLAARKDITLKKQLEVSLYELNQSLEKKVKERTDQWIAAKAQLSHSSKMSSLGEMAGGVAHEINNPLAVIKNVSGQIIEILDDEPIDKSLLKEMATIVETTIDRIAKIVQGLRSFSRDGSRDPFLQVNVYRLIDETVNLCHERFKNHGINLMVEDFDKELCFEGREVEISQVLLNLFNNSFDAIEKNKEKWVRIAVLSGGDWLEIQVTDSGKGIPLEIQEKIFDPFFTTKEVGKGTGLGLNISMGIIQNHNGQFKIDSECANTRFAIRLFKKQNNVAKI